MAFRNWLNRFRASDLQAKVILILIGVIFPLSIFIGLAQSKVMEPVLSEEVRQVGLSFSQNLSNQIQSQRLLSKSNPAVLIDDLIQRMMYTQPSILRVDVIAPKAGSSELSVLASSVEEEDGPTPILTGLKSQVEAAVEMEEGIPVWSIYYPVGLKGEQANIHVLASLKFANSITGLFLRINILGALASTILLILILNFFLRRAIENEKQLKVAQMSNEVLSEKLQEIQQELIQKEKLAVMGQLTASFAHEIGTPLNAVGGHIQLLNMDLGQHHSERIGIISSQLKKIEEIVKGFLLTTKKPIVQQKIRITARELIERIVVLVMPTLQRHQISFGQEFKAENDVVEVVPLEIEQVLLNLVNNAIDSMKEKSGDDRTMNALWIRTYNQPGQVVIEIQDSGTGISAENMKQIFKPFFTTKSSGEGHGLGLSICQQIVRAYGGEIAVESKLNRGTRMKVQIPSGAKS